MTKYNHKILKQKQPFKGAKFETLETIDYGNNHTWENIKLATSKDTLKFFRSMGSKQQVKTEVNNGLYTVKIYSYEPYTTTKRTLHIFTEVIGE